MEYDRRKNYKKQLIRILLIGLVLLLAWYIYNFIANRTVITISSESDAVIFIADEPSGDFAEIGVGEVTYITRQSKDYYFKAAAGEKESILGYAIEKGNRYDFTIPLQDVVDAELAYESVVTDAYITNQSVQGIEPGTSSIINFGIQEVVPPKLEFIGIPFLRSIAWEDSDSFAYSSFRDGVGLFIDGRNTNQSRLGESINTNDLASPPDNLFFSNVARHKGNPLLLLGSDGIYKSSDMGVSLEKIVHVDQVTLHRLFADNNYIYLNLETAPGSFVAETEEEIELTEELLGSTTTDIFTYEGELVATKTSLGTSIISARSTSDYAVLFGEKSTLVMNNEGGSVDYPSYFDFNRELVVSGDHMFALADNGLWRLHPSTGVFSLVHDFGENSIGITGSMVIDEENEYLYFGVTNRPGESANNKTFRVRVADLVE